jgi:hypothetical protein
MIGRPCTCAGTAPGYPQHEPGCGQPEPPECPVCDGDLGATAGCLACEQENGTAERLTDPPDSDQQERMDR